MCPYAQTVYAFLDQTAASKICHTCYRNNAGCSAHFDDVFLGQTYMKMSCHRFHNKPAKIKYVK